MIAGASEVVGLTFAFVYVYVLRVTHKYILLLRICLIGAFVGFSVGIYIFYTDIVKWIYTISLLLASFQIPAVPLTINFASEITFP